MTEQSNSERTAPATSETNGCDGSAAMAESSRRHFLKASAALAAGVTATQALPEAAMAQGASDVELNRVLQQRRTLLKGGVVLTLDRGVGDFAQADVLIEDGKICEVRPNIVVSDDAAAAIDVPGRILIPGFIDTHSHSYQGILRNILSNGRVDPDYNRDIIGKLTPAFTPVDAYAGMLSTALGMIEAGTTCVVDVSQVNNTPEHSDALIRALQDSGIRAVFAYSDGKGPAVQYPQQISRLQQSYFNSGDQLLTLALGAPPDPKMFALAREVGVPIVVHVRNVLPQRNDGEKLLQLSRAGLLRPGNEYIHCLHFPAETWRLIKDSGGHVSLSPPIEMTMGHGTPAIQEALDNGVHPSLSSDHAVTLSSDFFTLMRSTAIAQRPSPTQISPPPRRSSRLPQPSAAGRTAILGTPTSASAVAQLPSRLTANTTAPRPTWRRGLAADMASASGSQRMGVNWHLRMVALRSPARFPRLALLARRKSCLISQAAFPVAPSRPLIAKRAHADYTRPPARRVGAAIRIAARTAHWCGHGRRRRGARPLHEFQTDGLSSRTRAYGGDRIAQLLSGVCSRAENELSRTAHQRFDRTPAPRCSHLVQK